MGYTLRSKINHGYEKTWTPNPIPKPRSHKSWSKSYAAIKKHIRFHHSVVQDNICSYCRLPISFGGYGDPIEHIVPKSHNSYWMLHPRNLCLACFGCNTKKLDKPTLTGAIITYSKKYEDYPHSSAQYKIVHPHFDKFSDYIEIKGFIYVPKTGTKRIKGKNTIDICDLNRLETMYERARKNMRGKQNIYRAAIKIAASPNSTPDQITAAQALISELKEVFDYKKKLGS